MPRKSRVRNRKPPEMPTSVRILGQDWAVHCLPEWEKGTWGHTDIYKKVIRISTKYSVAEQYRTLLHEVAHVAFQISGLTEMMCPNGKGPLEESVTMCLESAYSELLATHGRIIQEGLSYVSAPTRTK